MLSQEGEGKGVFVSEATTVAVPAGLVVQRLRDFFAGPAADALASSAFAQEGLPLRVGIGPFTKRVVVERVADYARGSVMVFPFRWSVAGPAGAWFPVLDANLEVSPDPNADEREARSGLRVVGTYRPPLGSAGLILDRVVLNRVAVLTVRSFVARLVRHVLPEVLPGRADHGGAEFGLEWGAPATS